MLPYIIAELGVNFYDTAKVMKITPLEAAKLYIDKAKEAGVNAVKFQSYKADTIASKNSPSYWDLSKENTTSQYELFKKFDSFNEKEYIQLYEYCKRTGVDFLSTPFDYNSADYLYDLVDIYKISSSDLNNYPFLEYISKKGKPIYLSVGASYISEIEKAVRIIKGAGCSRLCLLHCMLSYPCNNKDANLRVIETLKRVFPDCEVGYSDHTCPDESMSVLTAAYMLGASVIEKHFTLDKTLKGNDHYHAGDPDDFKRIIKNCRIIDEAMGDGVKTVFKCEEESRKQARRSIVINVDKKKGEIISEQDITYKRPGTGIAPEYKDIVIGRKCAKDISADTILKWDIIG